VKFFVVQPLMVYYLYTEFERILRGVRIFWYIGPGITHECSYPVNNSPRCQSGTVKLQSASTPSPEILTHTHIFSDRRSLFDSIGKVLPPAPPFLRVGILVCIQASLQL